MQSHNWQQIEQQISQQRQRIKQISNVKNMNLLRLNKNNEHLVIFNAKEYPFRNDREKGNQTYKTIINSETVEGVLEKLILLAHPNIIQIQKIARSKPKNSPQNKPHTYYSLYYEVVPFSIKTVMIGSWHESQQLPKIGPNQLCQKLVQASEYLMKEDVFYLVTCENIGMTEAGEVKIYVSPLTIVDQRNSSLTKGDVMASIDRVMGWYNQTLSLKIDNNAHNQYGNLSNSLGFKNQEKVNPKISSSYIDKYSQEPQPKEENKLKGFSFPQKMKNIQSEIKNIKEKMKEKVKNRKQSDDTLNQKLRDRIRIQSKNNPTFQSVEIRKEQAPGNQPIQQNINTINIYNHPVKREQPQGRKVKNMSKQPIYSYTYDATPPQNLVRFKSQPLQQYPDDQFGLQQDDNNLSVDTYQMDIGLEFQPPIEINNDFRSSFSHNRKVGRQTSGKKFKGVQEQCQFGDEKASSNQVIANKKVTESAGPLQFKNFVVQFIKPQFLAKRSNIYEDPGQYESQKSHSLSKKVPSYFKDLSGAGKAAAYYRQNSVSVKRSHKQSQGKSSGKQPPKVKNNKKKPQHIPYKPNNNQQLSTEYKCIKIQKSEGVIKSLTEDQDMSSRVKNALQKTKHAIEVLKKVRMNKSPHDLIPSHKK